MQIKSKRYSSTQWNMQTANQQYTKKGKIRISDIAETLQEPMQTILRRKVGGNVNKLKRDIN